jgi:hypothetical protein
VKAGRTLRPDDNGVVRVTRALQLELGVRLFELINEPESEPTTSRYTSGSQ